MAPERVGLIGVGLLGSALAERLCAAGFEVVSYGSDPARQDAAAKAGARAVSSSLRVLMGGLAYSRVMETKGQKMLRHDFAPQAKLSQHLKDVRLILAAAERAGLALPLSETHRRLLEAAESSGFGNADNSAVIEVYSGRSYPTPKG